MESVSDKKARAGSCVCATPENIRKHGGKLVVLPECRYHKVAAENPMDHCIPWNCPTYWDGCNCAQTISDLRAEVQRPKNDC